MRNKGLWVIGVLSIVAACSSIPYRDDLQFLVSAQANSTEFPVYLNGHLCTDMEGSVGLCAKRLKSSDDLEIRFDPQSYAYALSVRCPDSMQIPPSVDVQANAGFSMTLTKEQMAQYLAFTCIGAVEPKDRTGAIAAGFEIHVVIFDSQYNGREKAYLAKQGGANVLVLGEYARDSWVFDEDKWSRHSRETVVRIKGDPARVKAYSSSYAMRFNFLNMVDSDGGIPND